MLKRTDRYIMSHPHVHHTIPFLGSRVIITTLVHVSGRTMPVAVGSKVGTRPYTPLFSMVRTSKVGKDITKHCATSPHTATHQRQVKAGARSSSKSYHENSRTRTGSRLRVRLVCLAAPTMLLVGAATHLQRARGRGELWRTPSL